MRVALFLAGLLALAGCATTGSGLDARARLVGTWLLLQPEIEFPAACASGLPIAYAVDGTFDLIGETGTWRLEGDVLTETTTAFTEAGDPDTGHLGRPFVSRIRWRGRDRFRKRFADGNIDTFRRCPATP